MTGRVPIGFPSAKPAHLDDFPSVDPSCDAGFHQVQSEPRVVAVMSPDVLIRLAQPRSLWKRTGGALSRCQEASARPRCLLAPNFVGLQAGQVRQARSISPAEATG